MHFRRNKPAIRTGGGRTPRERGGYRKEYRWMNNWPAFHDLLHHRRPPRRRDKRLERATLFDRVDTEATCWPTWRKPHLYWW